MGKISNENTCTLVVAVNKEEAEIFQKAINIVIQKKNGITIVERPPTLPGDKQVFVITSNNPYNFYELGSLFQQYITFKTK
jgi:hypothetical protein